VQFTVNGQFQPVIKSKAGQTEIWVLANVSDIAYINVHYGNGDWPASANHHRGAGWQSVHGRSLSADGQWDATAHSTGESLRDCGDDTG
jgi:hypothetical protein